MNNKLLSFAAAAASLLTIAACNKDDQKIDAIIPGATTVYAKVSISMPKGTQTRALNADPGEEYEANVSNVILAFYDEAGVFVGEGALVGDGFEVESSDDNVSHKSENNICQIQLLGEGLPTQVVAFINAPDGYKDYKKNLTDLMTNGKVTLEAGKLYGTTTNDGDPTDFVMTNSGYYGDNGYIVATQLTGDMLFEAADLADAQKKAEDADVTTIYVERLAAKIAVDASTLKNNPEYTIQDIQGNEVTLDFEATNWGATGIVKEENVVKYWESGSKSDANNDVNNYRSYWAEGVFSSKPFDYYYDEGKVADTNPLTYISYGDVENDKNLTEVGKDNVIYVPEHTTELQIAESAKNLIANTYALIVGEYTVRSNNPTWYQNSDEDTDFYLLLAGLDENEKKVYTIYSKSQLIAYLLNFNGITKVGTSEGDINVTTDVKAEDFDTDFDFTDYLGLKADPGTGKYVLAAGNTTLYYMNGNEATEVDAAELQKQTNSRHFHYTKGHAYFNAPILHDGTFGSENAIYGVVRNHSYVLNLTSVNSLGAPIDTDMHDPADDEPIIPNPDELTDHWIKAEIKVLSWNVKTSDVTL